MLDRGISFRCVLIGAAFTVAMVAGALSFMFGCDILGRVAMTCVALGFVLVVLNDNAKTRRLIWRLEAERSTDEHIRPMHSLKL